MRNLLTRDDSSGCFRLQLTNFQQKIPVLKYGSILRNPTKHFQNKFCFLWQCIIFVPDIFFLEFSIELEKGRR